MIYFIILVGLATVAATAHLIARDGRGPQTPPRSHRTDPDFLPPSTWPARRA